MSTVSGYKLQSNGGAQPGVSARLCLASPCCSQPLRRAKTVPSAAAAPAVVLTLEPDTRFIHGGPLVLDRWLPANDTSRAGFTLHSAAATNAAVTNLLREGQELAMQQLSTEISRLMEEVDTELDDFLKSTALTPPRHHHQQHPVPQPGPSALELSAASPRQATSVDASTPSTSSSPSSDAPLTTAAGATSTRTGPAGLSLLPLPAVVVGDVQAGSAGAGAGSRAQRRRQNWRRAGAVVSASNAPPSDTKFKVTGNYSISILMGTFSKDHILSAQEEQLLAAAAQDFMKLEDVTRVLALVLRRPPSVAEVAETMHCDETSLRLRLDCGSRARTILAQKNYRLVVNIAKRMLRPHLGASGPEGRGMSANGGMALSSGSTNGIVGNSAVSLDDAITVGMEGLMHAMRKFKPEAGYRLSTYATWWIRMNVGKYARAQAAVVSMPVSMRDSMEKLTRVRAALISRNSSGRMPTVAEVAEATGLSLARVEELDALRRVCAGTKSFEAPLSDGDESRTVADLIAQEHREEEFAEGNGSSLTVDSEEFYALSSDLTATVDDVLASLDRQEADLLREHYGLGSSVESGSDEEAGEMGRREAARQAEEAGEGGPVTHVLPGAQRLKLSGSVRSATTKAMKKLRKLNEGDKRLTDWRDVKSSKNSLAVRVPGYAKKSHD